MNVYRGDIFYIENSKYFGIDEQSGTPSRPGIIVSNDKCNAHNDYVTVVFLTTNDDRPDLPTHVPVICRHPSTALCETVCKVNQNRLGNFIRTCTDAEMQAIDKALMVQLGIEMPEAPAMVNKSEYDNVMEALKNSETKRMELGVKLEEYRVIENAKIEELDAVLDAEKATSRSYKAQIDELERKNESLQLELSEAKAAISEMEETEGAARIDNDVMLARAQAERDVYKQLVDRLLNERG